jgi:hypothetical protein
MEIYDPRYCEDLGDGYMLRWATAQDIPAFGTLCDTVFRQSADAPVRTLNAQTVADWTTGHPTTDVNDIAVVVDHTDALIAGAILLRQRLDYSGVQLSVGRPEMVVCLPEHRNNGFIRHIMRLLHAKSHARGDHIQAITGIPYFYRQFGYAYAIPLDWQISVSFTDVPSAAANPPTIALRKARGDEYGAFVALYDADRLGRGLLCTTPFERSYFQHLTTQSTQNPFIADPYFLVNAHTHEIIGYTLLYRAQHSAKLAVMGAGLRSDQSWYQVLPGFLQALTAHRSAVWMTSVTITELSGITFMLDPTHPLVAQLRYGYQTETEPAYAWYVRIDDYERLFEAIRPIIEARLRRSSMRGFSGAITVSLYGTAFTLHWSGGSLVRVEPTPLGVMGNGADAGYPADTFVMQVFGRNSFREIKQWHHEAWASPTAEQLLSIQFPTGTSWFLWLN